MPVLKKRKANQARILITANKDRKLVISGIHLQIVLDIRGGRALLFAEEESSSVCLVELVHPVTGFSNRH